MKKILKQEKFLCHNGDCKLLIEFIENNKIKREDILGIVTVQFMVTLLYYK